MPLTIVNTGRNNTVEISDSMRQSGTGTITLQGNNNKIKIADTAYSFGVFITMNENCSLSIGGNVNCFNLVIYMAKDATLDIGATVGFNGMVRLSLHEPGKITIGDGCLFADQVEISVSDMHSIVDATTKRRLNPAKDVAVGDRVWLGTKSLILKGVAIGAGTVIGAMSVVTRNVPENCIVAGNPAKIVRENVTWDFRLL